MQEVELTLEVNWPEGHCVQFGEPGSALNLPAPQLRHSDAPGEDTVPAAHGRHDSWPLPGWKRPGAQGLHSPRLGSSPNLPEGQGAHSTGETVKVATGQGRHTSWPVSGLYVPGAQGGHEAEPAKGADVPTGQDRQANCPAMLTYNPGSHASQLL